MIVALLGLFVALGGVGMAATGGNFILGKSNSADATTYLSAPVAGKTALNVSNLNTTTGSSALRLNVASGHPPLTVNSATRVPSLNSDLLDARDSTYFLPKTGKAANSDKLDGIDSTGFIQGKGRTYTLAVAVPAGQRFEPSPGIAPGFFNIMFDCHANGGNFLWAKNLASTEINLFVDDRDTPNVFLAPNTGYIPLPPTATTHWEQRPQADHGTLLVQGVPTGAPQTVATIEVVTLDRGTNCHLQVQALITRM